jgi:hypothetical protein
MADTPSRVISFPHGRSRREGRIPSETPAGVVSLAAYPKRAQRRQSAGGETYPSSFIIDSVESAHSLLMWVGAPLSGPVPAPGQYMITFPCEGRSGPMVGWNSEEQCLVALPEATLFAAEDADTLRRVREYESVLVWRPADEAVCWYRDVCADFYREVLRSMRARCRTRHDLALWTEAKARIDSLLSEYA